MTSECVFLALRDGIHLRNYAGADMLDAFQDSGLTFVLLTPEPEHPLLRRQFDRPCFRFERMDVAALRTAMRGSRRAATLATIRRYTLANSRLDDIGSLSCLAEIYRRETAAESNWRGRLLAELTLLGARAACRSRLVRKAIMALEDRQDFAAHAELYRRYRPRLTVVASPGYQVDALLMREARRAGARVAVAIKNWDVPTTKGLGGCTADEIFVWNDTMKHEMVRFHEVPPEAIRITGIPQWDSYFSPGPMADRAAFCRELGIPEDCRIIYFATTAPVFYGHNFEVARTLLGWIRDDALGVPAHLLLRLHPMYFDLNTNGLLPDAAAEMEALRRDFPGLVSLSVPLTVQHGGLQMLDPCNDVQLRQILSHSDVMVTIYSTQILEAVLFDLPVVNYGNHSFRGTERPMSVCSTWPHNLQISDLGGTTDCHTDEGLLAALRADLDNRPRLAEGRRRIADKLVVPALRGRGGETLARAIIEAAGRT